MRIEQHADLKSLRAESFRRNTRFDRALLAIGLFVPAIILGVQWLRVAGGHHVTPSQWVGTVVFGLFLMVVMEAAIWFYLGGNRYAEFNGDRVRLGGPIGSTSFRPSQLVSCKVEPDENLPEVAHLSVFFHNSLFRLPRPNGWSMIVDDREEAEEFCRLLMARADADGARFLVRT